MQISDYQTLKYNYLNINKLVYTRKCIGAGARMHETTKQKNQK